MKRDFLNKFFVKKILLTSVFVVIFSYRIYAGEPTPTIGETIGAGATYSKSIDNISVEDDICMGVFIEKGAVGKLTGNNICAKVTEAKQGDFQTAVGVFSNECNVEITSDIDTETTGSAGTAYGVLLNQEDGLYDDTSLTVGEIRTDAGNMSSGVQAIITGNVTLTTKEITAISTTNKDAIVRGVSVSNLGNAVILSRGDVTASNEKDVLNESINEGIRITSYSGTVADTVIGDVSGGRYGVAIKNNGGQSETVSFICTGTVSGNAAAIKLETPDEGSEIQDLSNIDIVVFGLQSTAGDTVDKLVSLGSGITGEANDIISYIVKDSDTADAYGKFTVEDTTGKGNTITIDGTTYQTGKALVATTVKAVKGYTLSSNKESTLVDNGDGTYTLTIPQEGGIILTATMIPVPVVPSSGKSSGFTETSKPAKTGSEGDPIRDGKWSMAEGKWQYTTNAKFVDTWGYIGGADENSEPHWYYFDKDGNMLTGWQQIAGKWYYFSTVKDATEGQLLVNTVTPDGYTVGPDGAWIEQ